MSISNMTSDDFTGILLIATLTAEPLVSQIPSKPTVGAITIVIIIFDW